MTVTVESPLQVPLDGVAPGVHQMPAEEYHGYRNVLSSSGARKLLPPSCPAKFRYEMDHGQPPRKTFELGTAAHRLVLGDGPKLVLVDAKRWDTDAIKARLVEIRAEGSVPLKRDEMDTVNAMAAEIRKHPLASRLFDPERGKPEQSLFWTDKVTGVPCRARLDWLPETDGGRLLVPDYKSAVDASEAKFNKAVKDYGYHQQADFYQSGIQALDLAEDVPFLFVVQEKTPPYLINVIQLSQMWLLMAEDRNKRARATFKQCTATGVWPGYGPDVAMVSPSSWLETEHEREYRP